MKEYCKTLIYDNPLKSPSDVENFVIEGQATFSFPQGRMRLENILSPEEGQKSNFVFWCDKLFPSNVQIEWDFWPIKEPGLCMLFFSAMGKNGEDIFDKSLEKREGIYKQYHHSDINTFHISYFRRGADVGGLYICNLRKSYGSHIVATGGDPIPPICLAHPPYQMKLIKYDNEISFFISDVPILTWKDDGETYGSCLSGGQIGFRQMAPLIAEYSDFKVYELK